MDQKRPIIKMACVVVAVALIIQLTACGYILYPERRGQKPVGRIDPVVAILDGLGLLLFIIPGVIAFAIDITNGTLYFPPGRRYSPTSTKPERVTVIQVNPAELNEKSIQKIVQKETGVSLESDLKNAEVYELDRSENIETKLLEMERTGYRDN